MAAKFATIDDYIASYPDDVQEILEKVRRTIRSAVPEPGETISYAMPTITLDGRPLVYFAAWKHHIGLYPIPRADAATERDLAPYRSTKDTVKLPLDKPIPYDLVKRLAALLVTRREEGSPDD
ncbi:MAG: DUF1801 domain-containing protein [Geodermatophilaceae bacterium]|nr:DUF1801 domain-containing protein [Geodermatophilaceae bacterium]